MSIIATAVVTGSALLAAPALGVTRYASPTGVGDCSQTSPCDLEIAVEGGSDGDEVIVASGDYGSPGMPLSSEIVATGAIDIHGPAGGSRPRVFSYSNSVFLVGPGATLRDIEIQHAGAFNALYLAGLAERIVVHSPANACTLINDGAVLRDSVCWATQNAPAVSMVAGSDVQLPVWTGTLRNVTAYSRLGEGIRVTADNFAQLAISATNVIARGGSRDVRAEIVGSIGTRGAEVSLDHSNYATRQQAGGGLVTAPGSGANQTASPLFVDDPLGDFHQLIGSPTINAGITDIANGAADFDGEARAQGASTDIGADEFPPVLPAPPGPVPVAPRSSVDKTKPVASGLNVRPNAFAALRGRGSSVVGTRKRVRPGATGRYRLTEAATLSFKIDRRLRGRRRGKGCLLGQRTGVRCIRYDRLLGGFQDLGRRGMNSFRFSGRLRNKPLTPGRYRLVGTPRDTSGNRGKQVRATFRIVRG